VLPAPATPTGLGTVIPRADPTVAAVGHDRGAAVAVGSAGDAVLVDGVDPAGDDDDTVLELPRAVTTVTRASVVRINRREVAGGIMTLDDAKRHARARGPRNGDPFGKLPDQAGCSLPLTAGCVWRSKRR
jgi:hypothetical protein